MSLLMWECGLKHLVTDTTIKVVTVTPYVGVWIETVVQSHSKVDQRVTPYVGVWIETMWIYFQR